VDSGTQALILGIAGLITGVITSWLSLFYTAQSRRATVRELLYAKQLDIVSDGLKLVGRMRALLSLLLSSEAEAYKERSREDIGGVVRDFSQLVDGAAALLPTELWIEFRNLNRLVIEVLSAYDDSADAGPLKEDFADHSTKAALLAKVFLAVDELSTESANLFKTKVAVERFTRLKASELIAQAHKSKTAGDLKHLSVQAPNPAAQPDVQRTDMRRTRG
jgi:hypothetical protein